MELYHGLILLQRAEHQSTIGELAMAGADFEAALADVNDSDQQARQLAALLKGRPSLINLIPYNPVEGLPYQTPSPERTARFIGILESAGLAVKTRYRKGDRIDAACGQLRRGQAIHPQSG